MSIIHDALKKARLPKNLPVQKIKSQSPFVLWANPRFVIKSGSKKVNWGPVFILLVLVLITGPVVAPIFQTPVKPASHALSLSTGSPTDVPAEGLVPDPKNSSGDKKLQYGVEELPVSNPAPIIVAPIAAKPDFVLNGVMLSSKDSYCLINGKIVRPGAKIDGATLMEATPQRVVLNYHGDNIVIPTGD